MGDNSLFPFLSQFDPQEQAEGSLDPLGLYSTADALAVRLAPGVRERQSKPRYLTLALAGMVACGEEAAASRDRHQLPAWLVYEWTIVEALVRQLRGTTALQGVPGRDKVLSALDAGDAVCTRTYLKSPAVFGFHGIYKVLGVKTGLFSVEGQPLSQGYRVLSAWQADQGLPGFVEGNGPGRELRRAIERAVRAGIDAEQARDPGAEARRLIAAHLNPHSPGVRERDALWSALTQTDAMRGEYSSRMVTAEGQRAWRDAAGSEAKFQSWLMPQVSASMRQLLEAIRAYERLARLLSDAFDEIRWRMTEERSPLPTTSLAEGAAVQQAATFGRSACADAFQQLGEIDPMLRVRAERGLAWVGESAAPESVAVQLLEHHARVQRAKPPNGKRTWFDTFGDGRVAIRPAYTVTEFALRSDEFVHTYRAQPLWSFATDLGKVVSSGAA